MSLDLRMLHHYAPGACRLCAYPILTRQSWGWSRRSCVTAAQVRLCPHASWHLQVVHRHALLAEVEREWEVGTRLGFLAEPDGTLPGFMGTGSALRDSHGHFRGMILERLHGRCVDKVICTRSFADVKYVHDMLKCVFTALERAQAWLGEALDIICQNDWQNMPSDQDEQLS